MTEPLFVRVVDLIRRSSKFSSAPFVPILSNHLKLQLYALYKQSTEGPCHSEKPSFFDIAGRYRREAWYQLGDMDKRTAMLRYIALVVDAFAKAAMEEEELEFYLSSLDEHKRRELQAFFNELSNFRIDYEAFVTRGASEYFYEPELSDLADETTEDTETSEDNSSEEDPLHVKEPRSTSPNASRDSLYAGQDNRLPEIVELTLATARRLDVIEAEISKINSRRWSPHINLRLTMRVLKYLVLVLGPIFLFKLLSILFGRLRRAS